MWKLTHQNVLIFFKREKTKPDFIPCFLWWVNDRIKTIDSKLYEVKEQNGCLPHSTWPRAFQACGLVSIPISWSTNPSFLIEQSCFTVSCLCSYFLSTYIFKSPDIDLSGNSLPKSFRNSLPKLPNKGLKKKAWVMY